MVASVRQCQWPTSKAYDSDTDVPDLRYKWEERTSTLKSIMKQKLKLRLTDRLSDKSVLPYRLSNGMREVDRIFSQ